VPDIKNITKATSARREPTCMWRAFRFRGDEESDCGKLWGWAKGAAPVSNVPKVKPQHVLDVTDRPDPHNRQFRWAARYRRKQSRRNPLE